MTMLYGAHVRANGIRQHYLRYGGEGRPVVIVPGIVSPAALWDPVGRRLGEAHDCYIFDVRGRGLSESGGHLDYRVDSCAADAIEASRALGLQQPVLVGHSMGARIALRAARLAPDRFSALVILDPPTSGPGRRPYPIPIARTLGLLRAAYRGEAEAALRDPSQAAWPEPMLRLRAEWLPTCDERAVYAAYEDFHHEDMFADLQAITVPVSLICASKGGVVSEGDAAEMRAMPTVRSITRVAHAGHQVQIDNFTGTCDAIDAALAE
jgi:N-formylmaleamate deformylase